MKKTLLQKLTIFSVLAISIYLLVDDTSAISYNGTSTLGIPSSFTYSGGTLKTNQYPYTGYPRSCMYTSGGWSGTTDWIGANSNQSMPTFCEQIGTQHWSYFLTYSEFDRNANSGNSIIVDHRGYYTQDFGNAIGVTVNLEYTSTGINIVNKVNDNSGLWDVEPIFFIPFASTSSGFYPDRFGISHISAFMTEFGSGDLNVTGSNVYSVFTLTCLYNSGTTSQCKMTDYTGSGYANNGLGYLLNTQYILGLATEFYPTSVMTQHKNYVAEDLSFSGNFDTATKFMIDWGKTNTFPNWLGTTNGYTTTPPENTGGTNTGTIDYYAECTGWTDWGCYVKGAGSQIVGSISSLFSPITSSLNTFTLIFSTDTYNNSIVASGSLFEISNTWLLAQDYTPLGNGLCKNIPTQNLSSDIFKVNYQTLENPIGRFFAWILDKVANVVNVILGSIRAVFMPINPPLDTDKVCYFQKEITIDYQKFIPTTNQIHNSYVPDQYNPNPAYSRGDKTLFDYVAILLIVSISLPMVLSLFNVARGGLVHISENANSSPFIFVYRKIFLMVFIPPLILLVVSYFSGGSVADFMSMLSNSLVIIPSYFLTRETIIYGFNTIWFLSLLNIYLFAYKLIQ